MLPHEFVRIGLPIGAKIQMLIRRHDHWEVWLGISSRICHPDKADGTLIRCFDDGRAEKEIRDPSGEIRVTMIKEAGR